MQKAYMCMLVVVLMICGKQGKAVVAEKYSIQVTVLDSITGQPLTGASIHIEGISKAYLTSSVGLVVIDSLPKGNYHIDVVAEGYHMHHAEISVRRNMAVEVLLCPNTFHLHEVVVHRKRNEEQATLQYKNTLNTKEVQANRGQNITELLMQVNGVSAMTTGPAISKPIIRGLHSQRMVMFVNQIRLEGQQWGAEHAPEIDAFAVDKVEVIKGASSVMFGAEAIAGVVKVTPKPYRQINGVEGALSLNAFSNNKQGALGLLLLGTQGKRQQIQWRLQSSLRKAGDSRAPDYVISNTGMEEANGSVAMRYNWSNQAFTEITYSLFYSRMGIMSASHLGNVTDLQKAIESSKPLIILPFTYDINRPYQQVRHQTVSILHEQKFTHFKTAFQYSFQLNERKEYDNDAVYNRTLRSAQLPAFDMRIATQIFSAKLTQQTYRKFNLHTGADIMLQNNSVSGLQYLIPDYTSFSGGVFALERREHTDWSLDLGMRMDYKRQHVTHTDRFRKIDQVMEFLMPTGMVTYVRKLSAKQSLVLNASSGWRAPSINELYSDGVHISLATYEKGNAELKPEQSYSFDIAWNIKTDKWNVELSAYNNYMHQFIYQLPDSVPILTIRGAFPLLNFKQTNANLTGADVTVSRKIRNDFQAALAYSYLYAQDVSNGIPLIFMPANRLRINIGYQKAKVAFMHQLFATINFTHVAEQKRYTPGSDYMPPPPAYQVIHFNSGFAFKVHQQFWQVSFGINNLMNQTYRDYMSRFRYFTDEAGRNFILRLTIPFNQL